MLTYSILTYCHDLLLYAVISRVFKVWHCAPWQTPNHAWLPFVPFWAVVKNTVLWWAGLQTVVIVWLCFFYRRVTSWRYSVVRPPGRGPLGRATVRPWVRFVFHYIKTFADDIWRMEEGSHCVSIWWSHLYLSEKRFMAEWFTTYILTVKLS